MGGEVTDEAAVEVDKSEEGLYFFLGGWFWPFRYSRDLYRIHFDLVVGDLNSEIFHRGSFKLALIGSEIKVVLGQDLDDAADYAAMLGDGFRED